MSRRYLNAIIALMVLACASPASAGFFDIVKGVAGSFGVARDVDALFVYVDTADVTFKKSIDYLFSVLATEDEKVRIEMELKAANEIQDPKEKESKIQAIAVEKEALVKKAVNRADCKNRCRALDKRQKALYANAAYNVLLAGVYDYYAVQQGKTISKKCTSSPASCAGIALKLKRVADIVMTLPKQITNIVDFGSTLSQIGSAANIEIQKPTSEKEKPREVEV